MSPYTPAARDRIIDALANSDGTHTLTSLEQAPTLVPVPYGGEWVRIRHTCSPARPHRLGFGTVWRCGTCARRWTWRRPGFWVRRWWPWPR